MFGVVEKVEEVGKRHFPNSQTLVFAMMATEEAHSRRVFSSSREEGDSEQDCTGH